jgi:hypothetical protein
LEEKRPLTLTPVAARSVEAERQLRVRAQIGVLAALVDVDASRRSVEAVAVRASVAVLLSIAPASSARLVALAAVMRTGSVLAELVLAAWGLLSLALVDVGTQTGRLVELEALLAANARVLARTFTLVARLVARYSDEESN